MFFIWLTFEKKLFYTILYQRHLWKYVLVDIWCFKIIFLVRCKINIILLGHSANNASCMEWKFHWVHLMLQRISSFLVCLFLRKSLAIVIARPSSSSCKSCLLLKNYSRYHYLSIMTRCICKTRGIILKAIVLELCPFLTQNFKNDAPDRWVLVTHVMLLFLFMSSNHNSSQCEWNTFLTTLKLKKCVFVIFSTTRIDSLNSWQKLLEKS